MTLFEDHVHDYFDGWNAHQSEMVTALFSTNATFQDPTLEIPARRTDFWAVMDALVSVFPDYKFEVRSIATTTASAGADDDNGRSRAYTEWTMKGTNTSPLKPGIDATGRQVHLNGVDVIDDGANGFVRINRYYDQKSMVEQIGLQAIVEPRVQGKATYGYSKRVTSGNPNIPTAFGITWILFRDQSELNGIRTHSSRIIQDFLEEPGFISIVTGAAGDRAFTVTAWESEEALERAISKGHAFAKQDFRTGSLSQGVWTSVWKPLWLNRLWLRCLSCGSPNDMTDNNAQKCFNCGSALPARPSYW